MYFLAGCDSNLLAILGVVKSFYNILLIAVPILLLVLGTVDLTKAVMAGDEKEIKGATGILAKRAGAAVAVFLLGNIISLVLSLVPDSSGGLACWGKAGVSSGGNNNTATCPSGSSNHNGTCYNPKDKTSICPSGYTYRSGTMPMCDPQNDELDTYLVTDSMCNSGRIRIDGYCYLIVEKK